MNTSEVILVDSLDQVVGTAPKMQAHELGLLHRAFSVFIYHRSGNDLSLLLQQRHPDKYHCGGLWTNACCSHPCLGESVLEAAHRRLKEELGISAITLNAVGHFQYFAAFENGLSEHELDHVFIGSMDLDAVFEPDPEEVVALRWIPIQALQTDYEQSPERYTPWFGQALNLVLEALCYK